MVHFSILMSIFLFLCAFVSGLMDTIAGGGGIITVPALLLTGLPPAFALGTNKLQASFGTFSAIVQFYRGGYLKLQKLLLGIVSCFVGASIGTLLVILMPATHLKPIVIGLLALVILYGFFAKSLANKSKKRMSANVFYLVFGLVLGFYDGFFGPGTGSFWVMLLTFILGFSVKKATIEAKVYNFISNVVSLAWFLLASHVFFLIGLMMGVGQCFGAICGAKIVMNEGAKVIVPMFRLVAVLMFLVLLYQL